MHPRLLAMASLVVPFLPSASAAPNSRLVVSTAAAPWQESSLLIEPDTAPGSASIDLDAPRAQTITGFGGCFNEQGWAVLALLDATQRASVLEALFGREHGCAFNLGRMPMGANDYSLDWYSFAEVPEDYALAHFSIARDRQHLIPYIKAAQALAPALQIWASPWCPPAWMKTNGHYAGMPAPVNDLRPDQAGSEMVTQFRMEPRVLATYADYFARFIDAYAAEGIQITAVHVQNEPNSCQNFPSCVWRPEDLATFIGDHLGPRLAADHRDTKIWLGTIERPQIERVATVLDSPAARYITGVGFQWAGKGAIPEVQRRYPALRLMQTETECGNGANDWAAAEHTWSLMHHYFVHGAEAYLYWNMILDETGNSRWGWRQNAMITIDRTARAVRYNPEYYLMRHLAAFVTRGARSIPISATGADALAFANPDGSCVVVAANRTDTPTHLVVRRAGRATKLALPARSFATATLPPSADAIGR